MDEFNIRIYEEDGKISIDYDEVPEEKEWEEGNIAPVLVVGVLILAYLENLGFEFPEEPVESLE